MPPEPVAGDPAPTLAPRGPDLVVMRDAPASAGAVGIVTVTGRRRAVIAPGSWAVGPLTENSGGCPGRQAGEESGSPRSGAGVGDAPSGEPPRERDA